MIDRPLAGRTALITGASKRTGRATALVLADEGVNIVVHYNRSDSEAKELMAELATRGVRVWSVAADFEKPQEYESLIQRTLDTAGALDILVNNASIFPPEKLDELTIGSLNTNVEVNAWVPFVLSRDFARLVGRGKIINMLDSRLSDTDWNHVGYILSKHVLAALTDMMAVAYAPNITVNGVSPGLILPPPGKDDSYLDQLIDTVPLKRHGSAEDIAAAILYLLKADFVTGEVIYVDGGRHLKEYGNG
jgi:pteridine reductase